MLILGIHGYAHDSSAALIDGGRIIAAAEEERFTRKKHTGEFPLEAIRYCLREAGASLPDIKHVAFSSDAALQLRKRLVYGLRHFPKSFSFRRHSGTLFLPFFLKRKLKSFFPEISKADFKLHFVNHHLAHAASTFLVSPFERAAILTVDGSGEWATTVLSVGEGNQIKAFEAVNYPHSLGFLYGAVTQFLGFRHSYDEGKVMALAAYGEPGLRGEFKRLIQIDPDGRFRLNLEYFDFHLGSQRWYGSKLSELLGPPRSPEEPIAPRHHHMAATLQAVIEEALLRLAENLHRRTGLKDLCLAGGVALNCSANGRLLRESPFQRIFVQPASGDGGTALGAALFISHHLYPSERKGALESACLGPGFSDDQIKQALLEYNLSYQRVADIETEAARLLAQGKIIGWFQGRMEFGPRALGARSILADPRNAEKRHYLNREIKGRESFRPFGPSVLEEEAHLFLIFLKKVPSCFSRAKCDRAARQKSLPWFMKMEPPAFKPFPKMPRLVSGSLFRL